MTEVSRQRTIKQTVFASLLQKREQVIMELANTIDKSRLIDETQPLKKTSPKTLYALLLAPILGLILPYILFFMHRSLKQTIESEADLKLITKLPLAGIIPPSGTTNNDNAFRIIRNNILNLLGDGQKTILLTSANQGDGKTFCATHLAEAFNKIGEKAIVCKLHDILPSGVDNSIHPDDLLAYKSLHHQLASLQEAYDIIILDGPEVDPYNEALIGGLADVICFVCRPEKTSKAAVQRLEILKKDNLLPSACIVLNK